VYIILYLEKQWLINIKQWNILSILSTKGKGYDKAMRGWSVRSCHSVATYLQKLVILVILDLWDQNCAWIVFI
jgi:hypothetical protein